MKFDRDKFIASSCVSSSNQSSSVLKQVGAPSDYRKLLTECQYFEQVRMQFESLNYATFVREIKKAI